MIEELSLCLHWLTYLLLLGLTRYRVFLVKCWILWMQLQLSGCPLLSRFVLYGATVVMTGLRDVTASLLLAAPLRVTSKGLDSECILINHPLRSSYAPMSRTLMP